MSGSHHKYNISWKILFLCEAECCWHVMEGNDVPDLNLSEKLTLLKDLSPYLVRMYTVLETTNLTLNCFQANNSKALISYLYGLTADSINLQKDKAAEGLQDFFKQAYMKLRLLVHDWAGNNHTLKRCILPSGKQLWLCPKHQSDPNVTVISKTASSNSANVKSVITEADIQLRDLLKKQAVDENPPVSSVTYSEKKLKWRLVSSMVATMETYSPEAKKDEPHVAYEIPGSEQNQLNQKPRYSQGSDKLSLKGNEQIEMSAPNANEIPRQEKGSAEKDLKSKTNKNPKSKMCVLC